jgi:hypothetical protein
MVARADGCTYDAGVLGSVSRSRPIFCRAVPNPNQRCDSHLPPSLYGLSATPFALVQADKSEADMKERVRHVEEALRRAKAVAQGAGLDRPQPRSVEADGSTQRRLVLLSNQMQIMRSGEVPAPCSPPHPVCVHRRDARQSPSRTLIWRAITKLTSLGHHRATPVQAHGGERRHDVFRDVHGWRGRGDGNSHVRPTLPLSRAF